MDQQQSTTRRSVTLAAIAMILALGAFGAAFFLLDGMSVVDDILAGKIPFVASKPARPVASNDSTSSAVDTKHLQLPTGMPGSFALRLWKEQVQSQATIHALIDGEVTALRVDSVEQLGTLARLHVTVSFKDSTSAPGVIGLRLYGDVWYLAFASGMRPSDTGGEADVISSAGVDTTGTLPTVDQVDIGLLNTILAENAKSKAATREYVDGVVKQVKVLGVQAGPDTVTIKLTMDETHEQGYGQIVLIRRQFKGEDLWFLARFTKTGSATGS